MSDTATIDVDERPIGAVEIRRAGDLSVDWPNRMIELLAMPYDADARVVVHGRAVVESCAPGAFDGVERRANRVKVNRDHNAERLVGRATALHPSRSEGLVAELRIARSALGDETLALAEDRDLEASVGFQVMPGGERWLEGRSRRRLERIFLDHIALVPEGAYGTGVIDVRSGVLTNAISGGGFLGSTVASTPNLDEVLAWMAAQRLQSPL